MKILRTLNHDNALDIVFTLTHSKNSTRTLRALIVKKGEEPKTIRSKCVVGCIAETRLSRHRSLKTDYELAYELEHLLDY